MKIEDMKNDILALLEKKYPTNVNIESSNTGAVERAGFMLENHAKGIIDACKKHGYLVSFRPAGDATLNRIRNGHPCKGHTIMNKSVKRLGQQESWTYSGDTATLEKYKGLVGYPDESNNLAGLWIDRNNKPEKITLADIDNKPEDVKYCYTGDYDMHDLFCFKGKYVRIIAGTPDEHSAIDLLNFSMLEHDTTGRKNKVKNSEIGRSVGAEYSLIRHGAQTSFMCFLHSITSSVELKNYLERHTDTLTAIPWEDSVMKISEPICIFDKCGNVFILNSMEEIYCYYKSNGMLEYIPFYYFFSLLRDGNPQKLSEYAETINYYLMNFCGIKSRS